ncbi:MAG: hypothetical protein OIF48_19475 [Silicimonas sp.]|nr:hypothetical protein [Silicimonas sp.]
MTPGDLAGHWVRRWIKAPGVEDHDTRVHWMQAGWDYADLRLPKERPDLSDAACLADLSSEALARLTEAEGFAGRIALEGRICTWAREINFHGVPEAPDVGEIRFDAAGRMIETGVHADYAELWEQQGSGPVQAMRFAGGGYAGVLVICGARAVLGIGVPGALSSAPLRAALAAGRKPEGLARLFDGLHALGRWDGETLTAELATQPFAEGRAVLTWADNRLTWHRIAFDGRQDDVVLELEDQPVRSEAISAL